MPLCVHLSQSLPNKQVDGGSLGLNGGPRGPFFQPPLFSPELPSPLAPIICPGGRARGPNEPFGRERKEAASRSCDVGVVVPFSALAMATGRGPGSTRPLRSGQRPEGGEAAVRFSRGSLLTGSLFKDAPNSVLAMRESGTRRFECFGDICCYSNK